VLPEMFEALKEVGTRRIIRDWLFDENITLPAEEEAKFMNMLPTQLLFLLLNSPL
jgi:hypothetical protein